MRGSGRPESVTATATTISLARGASDTRASTASILSEAGVPDVTISRILGHSQVQVTQRHYIHTDDRQMREALSAGWALLGRQGDSRSDAGPPAVTAGHNDHDTTRQG